MRGFDIVYIYNFTIFTNCQRTNIKTWKVLKRRSENAASHGVTQWDHFCASAHKRQSETAEWYSTNIFCVWGQPRGRE